MANVSIILVQRGLKFIFLQRADGSWTFPSGKVEANEDPIFAAVREAREECRADVLVLQDFGVRRAGDNLLHYFLGASRNDDIVLAEPGKFKRVIWAGADEILDIQKGKLFEPIERFLNNQLSHPVSVEVR